MTIPANPPENRPECYNFLPWPRWSDFRNRGIFYEAVTNQILDDLVAVSAPRRMTVVGDFSARGGITTTVTASYAKGS
jgi:NADPH-dependent 7-cyano-7-deazaguanine reductase QueF